MEAIKLEITNYSYFRIIAPRSMFLEIAEQVATVEHPKFKYIKKSKYGNRYGRWDGKIRLYNSGLQALPLGFLRDVTALLTKQNRKFEIVVSVPTDDSPYKIDSLGKPIITYKEYQKAAIEAALAGKRVAIESPTGSGKTIIGIGITAQLSLKTLWIVGSKDLLYQTASEFEKVFPGIGDKIGLIGDNIFDPRDITIAIKNSLDKIVVPNFWTQWRLLIVDEAHHGSSNTWYAASMKCTNAKYKIGMSGTMRPEDNSKKLRLRALFGDVYETVDQKKLIETGVLAKPIFFVIRPPLSSYPSLPSRWSITELRDKGARYRKLVAEGVIENEVRNSVIIKVAREASARNLKTLILVRELKHGKLLQKYIPDSIWLHGSVSSMKRKKALKQFERGEISCIIASTIFDEGVNLPSINILILAAGGKARTKTIQRLGRGLRTTKDKKSVLVIDFLDGRSSSATEKRKDDYLYAHSRKRILDVQKATKAKPKLVRVVSSDIAEKVEKVLGQYV